MKHNFETLSLPLKTYRDLEEVHSLYPGLVWALMTLPHTTRDHAACLFWTRNFIKANADIGPNSNPTPKAILDQLLTKTGIQVEYITYKSRYGKESIIITGRTLPKNLQAIYAKSFRASRLGGQQWGANNEAVQLKAIPNEVEPKHYQAEVIELVEKNGAKWQRLSKGLELALTEVLSWEETPRKLQSLGILRQAFSDPHIQYGPVANSRRLYAKGKNILGLPRAIRDGIILPELGFLSMDFICCQYFIAVKLWDVKYTFLSELEKGYSLWTVLQERLGAGSKDLFKEAIYCCLFGGSKDRKTSNGLYSVFEKHNALDLLDLFKSQPEVESLFSSRDRVIQKARFEGGVRLLDGEILPFSEQDSASIVCQQVQDYEALMLRELVKVLNRQDRTSVTAIIHDQVWVKSENHQRTYNLAKRTLDGICKELGILGGLAGHSPTFPETKTFVGSWKKRKAKAILHELKAYIEAKVA